MVQESYYFLFILFDQFYSYLAPHTRSLSEIPEDFNYRDSLGFYNPDQFSSGLPSWPVWFQLSLVSMSVLLIRLLSCFQIFVALISSAVLFITVSSDLKMNSFNAILVRFPEKRVNFKFYLLCLTTNQLFKINSYVRLPSLLWMISKPFRHVFFKS